MEGVPGRPWLSQLDIGRHTEKFDGLRRQQHRGRGNEQFARQRDNGTNRAAVVRFLVVIGIGWLLLLGGLSNCARAGGSVRVAQISLRPTVLDCRCCLRGNGMEMRKRQHKLDRKREHRQPRTRFHVLSKPVHTAYAHPRDGEGFLALPM